MRGKLNSGTALTSVLMGTLFLGGATASAADLPPPGTFKGPAPSEAGPIYSLPAVSAPIFTLEGFGGAAFGSGLGIGAARFTLPVGRSFGAQVDAALGTVDDDFYAQGAGHFFWRDPGTALVGLYGAWNYHDRFGGLNVGRVGPEFELYMNRVTLSGVAGVRFGDVDNSFFAQARLGAYLTDDLLAYGGYVYDDKRSAGVAGLEYQLPLDTPAGVAIFGEGRVGQDDYRAIWGGLRVYFGEKKSLIRRHREDVAPTWIHFDGTRKKRLATATSTAAATAAPTTTAVPTVAPTTTIAPTVAPTTTVPPTVAPTTTTTAAPPTTTTTASPSDIRLKRDIVALGPTAHGLMLYRFRYHWSDIAYVGVMAQEVLAVMPDAVIIDPIDGYMAVDYARLGLRMMRWDQWRRRAELFAESDAAAVRIAA